MIMPEKKFSEFEGSEGKADTFYTIHSEFSMEVFLLF